MSVLTMRHDVDPKKEILSRIPDISEFKVMSNNLLVATYMRPTQTKSGLYLSDKTREEDKFQGTIGLVLKKGPTAFLDDSNVQFHGQDIEVGSWVMYRPGDGVRAEFKDQPLRILEDVHVKMVVPAPDCIW